MNLFLNFGFAWISVLLTAALCIIYVLRISIKASKGSPAWLVSINNSLRKHHKLLGILLVVTGFVHGYFSSDKILSLNLGTVAWVVSILLGINWMARKALSKYKGWIFYHRFLTLVFVLTIILHVVQVGGIQVHRVLLGGVPSGESYYVSEINKAMEGVSLKNGTYTGEADGYRPGLKVSVTVKNNSITSIEILEHNEVNARYYQRAFDSVPNAILDSQSTEVDTVSGATFTSIGIMNAVNDALSDALVSGTLPGTQKLPENRGHGVHGPGPGQGPGKGFGGKGGQ